MKKNEIDNKYSIYMVDADEEFCTTIKECISSLDNGQFVGYESKGEKALDIITKHKPNIILMDCCNITDIKSVDIISEINMIENYDPHIMVFCSAGDDKTVQILSNYGLCSFCAKPYSIEGILIKINNIIKLFVKRESPSNISESTIVSPKHNVYLNEVTLILRKISMPPHIKGYHYFRQAIVSVIENPSKLDNIMEEIYTPIAIKHDTSINNVERIMRHAVEASWNRCKVSVIAEVFGNTLNANKDKPSNRELIAMLADKIRMKHGLIY